MHQIDHVIVREGKVILTGLPFADGQTVTISVVGDESKQRTSRSIAEVRQVLRGGVERFDEPFEPMIPAEQWEMLR